MRLTPVLYKVTMRMIADLYMQGKITQEDAYRMSAFCSTSGPMFIIGAVGIGMFKSSLVGYILFLSHILSAFLNGLIYRKLGLKNDNKDKPTKKNISKTTKIQNKNKLINKQIKDDKFPQENIITQSKNNEIKIDLTNQNSDTNLNRANEKTPDISEIVLSSTLAILSVGCIITIFFIIIECLSPIFNLFPENISALLEGIVEITKGCLSLSTLSNIKLAVILASFVISFGGISTLLQSITMLRQVKMPIKLFALQKLTHALLSALFSTMLVLYLM